MKRVRPIWWALLPAFVVALFASSGCDLFDSGGPTYAGVVVDAETQVPIEGIHVSLQSSSGWAGYFPVVAVLTDAEGRFRLQDPSTNGSRLPLFVNASGYTGDQPSPYNPIYNSFTPYSGYDFEDRHDLRIELPRLP